MKFEVSLLGVGHYGDGAMTRDILTAVLMVVAGVIWSLVLYLIGG